MKTHPRSGAISAAVVFCAAFLAVQAGISQKSTDAPGAHASDPASVERKNRAPVSSEVLHVSLPKAAEATLSNGLTVLIIEDHRLPLVSVQFNISASGPLFDPPEMTGLASIAARMMNEGTKSRTSLQMAQAIERLGASVSVASSFGSTTTIVRASGLSSNLDEWFALANDVLLNPSFPADELERLKQQLRIQLRQQRTDPGFLLEERFSHAIFGDHPAANVTAALTTIDSVKPETLAKWHNEKLTPQNAILGITGDVRMADLIPKLEKALSGWKKTDLKEVMPPNPAPGAAAKVHIVDRPNSVQTNLEMGNIAIDRRSPDYFPLMVANQVLGGSGSARLFMNLREQKGYTYGAYSSFAAVKYTGPWFAYGDVRTEVAGPAMAEFVKEIQRLRTEPVDAKELDDAKRTIVASFALSLEHKDELLSDAIVRKVYGLPENYWDTYPANVNAVTPADVQRVAQQYLDPARMQIAAVGDARKIRPVLQKYGAVDVYDGDGKKVGR